MSRASCGIYEALWLARLHQASVGALYLHIPFCVRKCAYCDFSSRATERNNPLMERYVSALERLAAQAAETGLLSQCQTVYVGGGTPTMLGAQLPRLVHTVRSLVPHVTELTCEANPDSLTDELLATLSPAGCTRLSIGVQSLNDGELQALGRIHTAAEAIERVQAAVASGMRVSCDLMCATPQQTNASWLRTLEEVLACGVGHVSVYPLQIEEGTPFDERYGSDDPTWNDPVVQAERMEQATHVLEAAGYRRYEVASYARPGEECQHNCAYWTAVPYLGLGTSASSMLTREAYERLRLVSPQLPGVGEDIRRVRLTCTDGPTKLVEAHSLACLHFDIELLTEAQAVAEDLMLGMRMTQGVMPGLLDHARAVLGAHLVDEALEACASKGLVDRKGGTWAPTAQGWLLGNELYGELWDLAPGETTTTAIKG